MRLLNGKTIGEHYGPAMEIATQEEADFYFVQLVAYSMGIGKRTRKEAEETVRENLSYYAGYYGAETRRRVEKLFACAHPVFGSIEEHGEPTAAEAFAAGQARGSAK